MNHQDVLRISPQEVYSKVRTSSPTAIPNDLGYYKRIIAETELKQLVTQRARNGEIADPVLYAPFSLAKTIVGYKTGSGSILSMSIAGEYLLRTDVPLMTEWETFSLCADCKGSNGGCPGFAPWFNNIKHDMDRVFVLSVTFDMAWALRYASRTMSVIMNGLSYADRLTNKYVVRLCKSISQMSGGLYLSLGSCNGCATPRKCSVIIGGSCNHPDRRTFSVESTGVDVDELHYMMCGEYLPWYYRGTKMLPTYMTRYAMFFVEPHIDYKTLLNKAVVEDQSYCDPKLAVKTLDLKTRLLKIPHGVHVGINQWVYEE